MPPIWTIMIRGFGLVGVAVLLWLSVITDVAPFTTDARAWPLPDLLFLALACLALRRPSLLPAPLVMGAGLLRDLLTGAAVGPGALALMLGVRLLGARAEPLRNRSLAVEWAHVAVVAVLVVTLPALMLWATLASVPHSGDLLGRWAMTVIAYPAVVLVLRVGREHGLRPGEIAREGRA